MPNYCNNDLTVSGPKEAIDRFLTACSKVSDAFKRWSKIEEDDSIPLFSFGGIVPIPDEIIIKNEQDETNDEWHSWCLEHWGTKCDISMEDIDMDRMTDESLSMTFQTVWSPPVAWAKAATEQFPELQFQLEYIEVGNNFKGTSIGENGVFVDECHEMTQKELAEYFGDEYNSDECEDDVDDDDYFGEDDGEEDSEEDEEE